MELQDFDFTEHIRKPFSVHAVRVTRENMEDIAPFVGKVERTPEGKPYIQADRHLCQSSLKVWPGYYVTKHGKKVRVFSRKAFEEQFHPMGEDVAPWVEYLNGAPPVVETKKAKPEVKPVAQEDTVEDVLERMPDIETAFEGPPLEEAVFVPAPRVEIQACEHGTPEGVTCAYRPCNGPVE